MSVECARQMKMNRKDEKKKSELGISTMQHP